MKSRQKSRELVLVWRPPEGVAAATVYWNKKQEYFQAADMLGNERCFTFERYENCLSLNLVDEAGERVGRHCFARANLEKYNPRTKSFRIMREDEPIEGASVRAREITKWGTEPVGVGVFSAPRRSDRGHWVLPAFIAHLKREGAQAMVQYVIDPRVQTYYEMLGFKKIPQKNTHTPNEKTIRLKLN